MRISATLLAHVRIALLGSASGAIEDLWELISALEGRIDPSQPEKRAAYRSLMARLLARYELQQTVGLPGEPVREHTLSDHSQQELVREVLEDYRAAANLLLETPEEMGARAQQEATQRVQDITTFLEEHQPITRRETVD